MEAIVSFNARGTELNTIKAAMLDDALAKRIAIVRTDPNIAALGPYYKADCALAWASEALDEAVNAGAIKDYNAFDILIIDAMALSGVIISEGIV